jgi:hypothetical protein
MARFDKLGEYIEDLFKDIQTSPSKIEEIVQVINAILENFINVVFKAVEGISNDVSSVKSEIRQSINNLNTKVQALEGRMSSMRTAGPAAPATSPGLPPPTTAGPSEPFLTPPPTTAASPGPPGPESPPPVTGATLRMQLNSELKKAFSRIRGGESEE